MANYHNPPPPYSPGYIPYGASTPTGRAAYTAPAAYNAPLYPMQTQQMVPVSCAAQTSHTASAPQAPYTAQSMNNAQHSYTPRPPQEASRPYTNPFPASQPTQPTPNPRRFIGPDARNTIFTEDATGNCIPAFTLNNSTNSKPQLSVLRLSPNGQQTPFFTATTSSVSSNSRIHLGAHEIELKRSYTSSNDQRVFESPLGKLTWRSSAMGSTYKLRDKQGKDIAIFDKKSGPEPRLEVLVACDGYLTELILVTALTICAEAQRGVETLGTLSDVLTLLGA